MNPEAGPEQVEKVASLIGSTARQALDDLRGVLGVLRSDAETGAAADPPAELAPQPRLDDLPRLVEASVAAGVPVTFEDRRPPTPDDGDDGGDGTDGRGDDVGRGDELVGRTVYRVVQEALTNVHKHAGHAATRVVLEGGDDAPLRVEIANVRPVAASALVPGAGAGLVGLRERVALAGGRFDAGPSADGGWRVLAEFPCRTW